MTEPHDTDVLLALDAAIEALDTQPDRTYSAGILRRLRSCWENKQQHRLHGLTSAADTARELGYDNPATTERAITGPTAIIRNPWDETDFITGLNEAELRRAVTVAYYCGKFLRIVMWEAVQEIRATQSDSYGEPATTEDQRE